MCALDVYSIVTEGRSRSQQLRVAGVCRLPLPDESPPSPRWVAFVPYHCIQLLSHMVVCNWGTAWGRKMENSDNMENKRRTTRIVCDAIVDYSTPHELVLDHYLDNLSLGGACIRAAKVQPEGTPVVLMISFPDLNDRTVEIDGIVAWANDMSPQDMGIRFVGVTTQARDTLREYMKARAMAAGIPGDE